MPAKKTQPARKDPLKPKGGGEKPSRGRTRAGDDELLVEISEAEKQLLAKQLHDGLLQTLSAASILIRVVRMRAKEAGTLPEPEFATLQQTVDGAIDEARHLIGQLQAPGPENKSLITALQELADSVASRCPCEFNHELSVEGRLGSATTIALFRVAQEAVKRAWQDPQVSQIKIDLGLSGGLVRMEIHARSRRPHHRGRPPPPLMESHAQVAGGELTIVTTRQGTLVTCLCRPAPLS